MLNPKNITIFLLLFVALLLGYFGVLGKWDEIGTRNLALDQAKILLDAAKSDLVHAEELLEFYGNLSEETRSHVIQALPSDMDLPNILVQIDRIAAESGVLLDDFSVREALKPTGFIIESEQVELPYSLLAFRAKGEYSSTKEFVSMLEKFLRVIDVETILLSSPLTIGGEPTSLLEITITAKTYEFQDRF